MGGTESKPAATPIQPTTRSTQQISDIGKYALGGISSYCSLSCSACCFWITLIILLFHFLSK